MHSSIITICTQLQAVHTLVSRPALLFLLAFFNSYQSHGQTVFSRFDFNTYPLTTASIGPDGLSTDPDAATDGTGAYISANCVSFKGIDLELDTRYSTYDLPEIGMHFRFRKDESFANFFERGNTRFFVQSNLLLVQYETRGPGGIPLLNGPFATGYRLPNDNAFREYTFIYEGGTGIATVLVDSIAVWQNDGPDNSPLYWNPSQPAFVGTIMDGTCQGRAVLDYAYFFYPNGNGVFPVEFVELNVSTTPESVNLEWIITGTTTGETFYIEKRGTGESFSPLVSISKQANISTMTQDNIQQYRYSDPETRPGTWQYRVGIEDENGQLNWSDIISVSVSESYEAKLKVWPVPASDNLNYQLLNCAHITRLELTGLDGRRYFTQPAQQAPSLSSQIPVHNLSPGLYFLKVEADGKSLLAKIIIR